MAEPQVAPAREVYLYPGQLVSAGAPTMVTTILGTCVSVCLFDAATAVGGMNHFMLPEWFAAASDPARFGDRATADLVDALVGLGASPRRLVAKVFGGMAARSDAPSLARDLGDRNVAMAFATLGQLGIPVQSHDVGGRASRKVRFHTADGRAWVRCF